MSTLTLDTEPSTIHVTVTHEKLIVELTDGRSLVVPLAWYPHLLHGSFEERQNWQLLGEGYAIEWPELDEHIGIEGLLAGRRSSESPKSLERWLANRTMQRRGEKHDTAVFDASSQTMAGDDQIAMFVFDKNEDVKNAAKKIKERERGSDSRRSEKNPCFRFYGPPKNRVSHGGHRLNVFYVP